MTTSNDARIARELREHADHCEARQVYDSSPSLYREAAEALDQIPSRPPTPPPSATHAAPTADSRRRRLAEVGAAPPVDLSALHASDRVAYHLARAESILDPSVLHRSPAVGRPAEAATAHAAVAQAWATLLTVSLS